MFAVGKVIFMEELELGIPSLLNSSEAWSLVAIKFLLKEMEDLCVLEEQAMEVKICHIFTAQHMQPSLFVLWHH